MRPRFLLALLPILGLAGALRFWGLDYGIPHPTARPDEERLAGRAQHIFATSDWDPGSFFYPSLPFYADTLALHAYYGVGKLFGRYERPFDFLFEIAVTRPGLHYLIARRVSALAGVATVLAAWALSMAAYGRAPAALLAASALAVCHLHVRDSHFATVDVLMTLFVTLSLLFSVRAARSPRALRFALAGLFAGLAVSSKYNAGVVLLAVLAAAALQRPPAFRKVLLAFATAAAAFSLTSPYVLLRLGRFASDMSFLQEFLYGSSRGELALWSHLSTTIPHGLGWPLALASALGIGRAIWLRRPADIVLLSFTVPFLLLVSSVRIAFPRYLLPVAPVLLVLAAESLDAALDRFAAPRARVLTKSAVFLLALVPSLSSSIAFDRLAARADTRVQAASFLSKSFRPRTRIHLCQGYGAPAINQDRRRPPAFVVKEIDCLRLDEAPAEAQFLVTHEHEELSSFSRLSPSLAAWLEERAEILASFDPYRRESGATPVFYGSDAFYIPFAGFRAVERGGPLVRIWKIESR